MKTFQTLINETLEAEDLEELEAAADLFQFGIEKGYYNKRQVVEFNNTYWSVKNRCLAFEVAKDIKGNKLDIINIVSNAPANIKDNKMELTNYVNGRIKALKGKIKGIK
ncbi:hypothetical protein CPJCM30710_02710 [Clostridium polyendosporum]|uniref:Uncharacterized protein n=1 Tax=Clostridium polyendosporum TaxID=69208 RepID=A0A919RW73_9CLOT|nr:hypothetical protein [Clostridium polyendosporum]GIM27605.1 hypothetical protein CPJCM30710_02710 [Clostridium polyendosporum]